MRQMIMTCVAACVIARRWRRAAVSARIAVLLAGALALQALVDPALQPIALVARHQHVVVATVSAIDDHGREATFAISRVIAGTITLTSIVLETPLPDPASGHRSRSVWPSASPVPTRWRCTSPMASNAHGR